MKVRDVVWYKRHLKDKDNEEWNQGIIHHLRKYDEGDRGMTIERTDGTFLKLINDAPSYMSPDLWRKIGTYTYYQVEIDYPR